MSATTIFIKARAIYTKANDFFSKETAVAVQTKNSDSKTLANYKRRITNQFQIGGN